MVLLWNRKMMSPSSAIPSGPVDPEPEYVPELVANEEDVIDDYTSEEPIPTNRECSLNVIHALSDKGYTGFPAYKTEFYHDFTPSFLNADGELEPGGGEK